MVRAKLEGVGEGGSDSSRHQLFIKTSHLLLSLLCHPLWNRLAAGIIQDRARLVSGEDSWGSTGAWASIRFGWDPKTSSICHSNGDLPLHQKEGTQAQVVPAKQKINQKYYEVFLLIAVLLYSCWKLLFISGSQCICHSLKYEWLIFTFWDWKVKLS